MSLPHLKPNRIAAAALLLCQFGIFLLVCSLGLSQATAEDEQPASEPQAVSQEQISEWIVLLDDDLYINRKNAQEALEKAGDPALEATAEEARVGTLESSTRALNIILAWTESSDHNLKIAALKQLAALPNHPVEAVLAAKMLADAHEHFALQSLKQLGARFELDTQVRALPVVKGLRNLHIVIDENWKGELEGLNHLSSIPRATTISFYFAPLDDQVVDHLSELTNVRRLNFYGTPLSQKAAAELKERLPSLDKLPFVTRGALLGITGNGNAQGPVHVESVSKGFAAEKAGLMKGDKIIELEGQVIKDFHNLTEKIGKFKPGETAELTILRGEEEMKMNVTFDGWGKQLPGEAGRPGRAFPAHQIIPQPRIITLERR